MPVPQLDNSTPNEGCQCTQVHKNSWFHNLAYEALCLCTLKIMSKIKLCYDVASVHLKVLHSWCGVHIVK